MACCLRTTGSCERGCGSIRSAAARLTSCRWRKPHEGVEEFACVLVPAKSSTRARVKSRSRTPKPRLEPRYGRLLRLQWLKISISIKILDIPGGSGYAARTRRGYEATTSTLCATRTPGAASGFLSSPEAARAPGDPDSTSRRDELNGQNRRPTSPPRRRTAPMEARAHVASAIARAYRVVAIVYLTSCLNPQDHFRQCRSALHS
jgi:hypothetical protein